MKSKKGFLLAEETLKIILGVIGIMFLAYLLFALYKSNSDSKDLEEAKASLARFFVETEKEAAQVQISNPEGWYMISWPNNGQSLESCSNIGWASCLCICEDKIYRTDLSKECNSAGACLENIQSFEIKNLIVIDNPPITLNVNYETREISKS